LLGQPSQSKQQAWRSTERTRRASVIETVLLLYARVVELTKHALQGLQRPEDRRNVRLIVEIRGDVDQISQFLGVDAQIVKGRRRGVVLNAPDIAVNSSAESPSACRDHFCEPAPRIPRLRAGRHGSREEGRPV